MLENFKLRDLVCPNLCETYLDVWTRKNDQGEIEIQTDDGAIKAICEKCHSKLEFALTPFNIGKKTSGSDQKNPGKCKNRPEPVKINFKKPSNEVQTGDIVEAKIGGKNYEGKVVSAFGNNEIGGAITVFKEKTDSSES